MTEKKHLVYVLSSPKICNKRELLDKHIEKRNELKDVFEIE